ncbi:MAG: hypothetical protein ACKPKO_00750, partial [Candidatus Fonsibacter sp.]
MDHLGAWLVAAISYWRVDLFARDAIARLLTDESPNWLLMQKLLHRARSVEVSRVGAAEPQLRQGFGAAMRACPRHIRTLLSLRRWHELVVQDKCIPEHVAAIGNPESFPIFTYSLAASFLTRS